jgi:hypothetical protein
VKCSIISCRVKSSRDLVQGPAEQDEIVDDRVGEVTDVAVEIHDDGVERIGRHFTTDGVGNGHAVVVELFELRVLQVLGDLPFAELVLAPRLGHVRQMGVLRQLVAEALGDEDLPRRVGKMLLGPDDVGDLQVVVVHDAGQVIEAGAVGALDHVVLLVGPAEGHVAAHEVVKAALPLARHEQPHHRLTPFRLEAGDVRIGPGHPAAAVLERAFLLLRRLTLRLDLLRPGVVAIGEALLQKRHHRGLIAISPLRLIVRLMRTADPRPFVPVQPDPAKAVQDRLQGGVDVPLHVGIIDPQDELPPMLPREQPIE